MRNGFSNLVPSRDSLGRAVTYVTRSGHHVGEAGELVRVNLWERGFRHTDTHARTSEAETERSGYAQRLAGLNSKQRASLRRAIAYARRGNVGRQDRFQAHATTARALETKDERQGYVQPKGEPMTTRE